MTWANAVVAANGGNTRKLIYLFPPTGEGADSTIFHKILSEGRPSPAFFLNDGSHGPALVAEKEYPGTLMWLMHPLWITLSPTDYSKLRGVYQTMATLQIDGCESLVKFDDGGVCRSMVLLQDQLEAMRLSGCMDSLTGVILLAQEAFCLCNPKGHAAVYEFSRKTIPSWPCLSWLPPELKLALSECILQKIRQAAPAPLDSISSHLFTFEQSILNLESTTGSSRSFDIYSSYRSYASSMSVGQCGDAPKFDLPRGAQSTLRKRIQPWLDSGAP